MAPPHRPSDVLSVRATLAVPVGRASIALRVGGADSMYANVIWHRRSSMAPPVARPIATFGCPRTAMELVQSRLVDLQWHRRLTYRDTNFPSHVAVRNRVGAGGAAVLYEPGHGPNTVGAVDPFHVQTCWRCHLGALSLDQ
jgi:hypothetical protein